MGSPATAAAPAGEVGGRRPGEVLAVATVGFAINFWAWALISPLGAAFGVELGLSAFEQSLVVAVPVVVGSLGRIPVGALTDRVGARVMFPAVSVLTILPVLFVGLFGDSLVRLLIGGFFLGLGGTAFAVGVPLVNSWYPPERRGLAIGIFGVGMGGTAVSAFTTVRLADAVDRSTPFLIVAGALAVYAAAAAVLLRDRPGRAVPSGSFLGRTWATFRMAATLRLSFLYAIGFGGFVAFSVYLPTYLINAYDLSQNDASLRTAGFVVLAVVMRPLGGWLSDRFDPVPVLTVCFAAASALAALAAAEFDLIPLGTVAFLGLAAALGASSGAVFALVARLAPADKVGAVTGIVGAAGGLGGFVPPLVMGVIYGRTGDYSLGLALLSVVALATAVFTWTSVRKSAVEGRAAVTTHRDEQDAPAGTAAGLDGQIAEALVRARRYFTRASVSDDLRTLHQVGGRQADDFYRDRWSHDKVVRSTHGVNCTGSCSWKVYVKDGIITWETQQTDYPSVGPDSPEYEPRGCPRGAAFSWYTYSPTRIRYPYVRGVLLQMYREAKSQHDGDPVRAWAHVVDNPLRAKAYKSARGKGGFVRASWEEATEMVAAAHVHTIKTWGPDRVAGFSPIPAMSMVSHASGARFVNLIGGSMLSFYDWYADLPVASPQVFGDQTDVPESGDWWNAGYLIMWGSNLPGHPHAGRALDDRSALPRSEGGRRRAGLRRQREVRRRVAACPTGHGRRPRDGHGPRDPAGVLRRPAGAVLRRLRQEVHRSAVPGPPRAGDTGSDGPVVASGQVPHRRRHALPRARGERRVQAGADGLEDGRTGGPRTARSAIGTVPPARVDGTSTSVRSSPSCR